jgi:hypothetical protein
MDATHPRAPWYMGILIGLLTLARAHYPQYVDLIDALLAGLVGHFGINFLGTVRTNGNGKGNGHGNGST